MAKSRSFILHAFFSRAQERALLMLLASAADDTLRGEARTLIRKARFTTAQERVVLKMLATLDGEQPPPTMSSMIRNARFTHVQTVALNELWDDMFAPPDYGDTLVLQFNIASDGETLDLPTQDAGTFNATVDWGDGQTSTVTSWDDVNKAHEYATAGLYNVYIDGDWGNLFFSYGTERLKLQKVLNWGDTGFAAMNRAFIGCQQLTSIAPGPINLSACTSLSEMFGFCPITEVNWGAVDTSLVTTFNSMFSNCASLASLGSTVFDTSGAVDDAFAFMFASTPLETLDLRSFDTSGVTSFDNMFSNCSALKTLLLPASFITAGALNTKGLIRNCAALTSIDLSGFDMSTVTTMDDMFSGCAALTSIDLSTFATPAATSMSSMFSGCAGLTSFDTGALDTSLNTDFSGMFTECAALTSIDLSGFDTSSATGAGLTSMFSDCSALTSVTCGNFDMTGVTSVQNFFIGCSNLTSVDVDQWDITSINQMTNFMNASVLPPEIYDAILISWGGQTVLQIFVTATFTLCKYSPAALSARTVLEASPANWTVNDAGPV